ncbi:MAG: hypothetical protein PHI12_13250 [Dehalococcoidales bacterium]|nr:hypothetical protein [Dehalococcoidales bacterium]
MPEHPFDGVAVMGSPRNGRILRFFRATAEPMMLFDTEDPDPRWWLNAQEMLDLYDALTPRIEYLRKYVAEEKLPNDS